MNFIKRISKISNIGSFYSAVGLGKFDFDKLNVIYGHNTYGKSTLAHIFYSLNAGESQDLTQRLSIPSVGDGKQQVELRLASSASQKETAVMLADDKWSPDLLSKHVMVFDNNFISNSVIAGHTDNRLAKEELSDFILGEEGVALSNTIGEKKRQHDDAKRGIRMPGYLLGKTAKEESDFLSIDISQLDKLKLQSDRQAASRELENLGVDPVH